MNRAQSLDVRDDRFGLLEYPIGQWHNTDADEQPFAIRDRQALSTQNAREFGAKDAGGDKFSRMVAVDPFEPPRSGLRVPKEGHYGDGRVDVTNIADALDLLDRYDAEDTHREAR